jgi:hypothetical protein
VRSSEASCPFCEASLPGKCELPHASPVGQVSNRSVLTFFAATAALVACGKSTKIEEHPPMTVYGPPPMDIAAPDAMPLPDAGSDGAK